MALSETKLKKTQLNLEKQKLKSDIRLQQQQLDLERQKAYQELAMQRQAISFAREQAEKEEERRKILARKEDATREGNLHALISTFPRIEIEKDNRLETIKLDLDNNVSLSDEEEAYLHAKAQALGIEGTVQEETTEHRYDG